MDTYSTWQKQKQFLDQQKKLTPELFKRESFIDSNDILKKIGIEVFRRERPVVYLKLWPQDFVVEEVSKEGQIHTVDYTSFPVTDSEGQTVYADLVKVGLSTLDVIEELSKILVIDRKAIGHAGIKDRDALTSQQLSFRNISIEKIKSIQAPNFFFKNIFQGKGAIQIGDLEGNKFTLVLRGVEPFSEVGIKEILADYEKDGFWNFFYTQRFGTPRLIAHYLGLLLLQCDYENVLKVLFTFPAKAEIGFYQNLRKEIGIQWGNWKALSELLQPLAYGFRRELLLLNHLIKNPIDFLGALRLIPDQVQLWIFAYGSFLFNRKLSQLIRENQVPAELPLVLSRNPADWSFYEEFLRADGLIMPSNVFRDFPSIQLKDRKIITQQKFQLHGFKVLKEKPNVAIISFTLPKGSYATTLLAHLFALSGNIPVLSGIDPQVVDAKEILGTGTIGPVIEIFKGVINSKIDVTEELAEGASE